MAASFSLSRITVAIKFFKTQALIRQSLAVIQGVHALEHKSLAGEGDGFRVEHRIIIDMLKAVEAQLKDALEVADLGGKS